MSVRGCENNTFERKWRIFSSRQSTARAINDRASFDQIKRENYNKVAGELTTRVKCLNSNQIIGYSIRKSGLSDIYI